VLKNKQSFKMTFLINSSNIKNGGGIQVAHSICGQLHRIKVHKFVVVLSSNINVKNIKNEDNVKILRYDVKHDIKTVLFGKDPLLDELVKKEKVDAVLTVFGPSIWRPRVPHLCGFARAQLLLKNPQQKDVPLKEKIMYRVWEWGFKKSSDTFYTENQYISDMLPILLGNVKVFTVTNYYNQIFDNPDKQSRSIILPDFDGTTMISISSTASHKNLKIMIPVSEYLEKTYPDFQFRFVLTCEEAAMPVPASIRGHFVYVGKVDVSECPNLYEQADIMFMPSLMECFTATYPEAMRMEVPIVTTDLEFARGLCGNAACYYSATDPEAAAEAIYRVATDKNYANQLVNIGKKQLLKYDNYEQRLDKLIHILEGISSGR